MLVQSVVNILESAVANRASRNLSGYVKDLDGLFTPANVAQLESVHDGVFAFFAFHPLLDTAVAEYLRTGALADDAGPDLFALFSLDVPAHTPMDLSAPNRQPWISVSGQTTSYTTLVRELFATSAMPTLPSLLVLERLSSTADPVAVSLAGLTTAAAVRTRCVQVCDMASRAYRRAPVDGEFVDLVTTELARQGLEYQRGGTTSIFEWFVKTVRFAQANAGTIVSIVKLF